MGDRNENRIVTFTAGKQGEHAPLFVYNDRDRVGPNITAETGASSDGTPPKSSVTLVNPPSGFADHIRTLGTSAIVRVEAGYGSAKHLFTGHPIRNGVKMSRSGGDWTLKIDCMTGGAAYRNATAKLSIEQGTSFRDVIAHAVEATGLDIGDLDLSAAPSSLPRGRSFDGPAFLLLDRLAKSAKCEVVNDGKRVHFVRASLGLRKGLELAPVFDVDLGGVIDQPEMTDKGLSFKSFLRTDAHVGQQVRIKHYDPFKEKNVNGLYVLRSITHKIQTHGSDFHTQGVARLYKEIP